VQWGLNAHGSIAAAGFVGIHIMLLGSISTRSVRMKKRWVVWLLRHTLNQAHMLSSTLPHHDLPF
jgi:hypothetical protein